MPQVIELHAKRHQDYADIFRNCQQQLDKVLSISSVFGRLEIIYFLQTGDQLNYRFSKIFFNLPGKILLFDEVFQQDGYYSFAFEGQFRDQNPGNLKLFMDRFRFFFFLVIFGRQAEGFADLLLCP